MNDEKENLAIWVYVLLTVFFLLVAIVAALGTGQL